MTGRGLLTTGHCSRASDRSSLAPRPTIAGVRRRCRAPSWVQHCSPGQRAICYEMLRFPVFSTPFQAVLPPSGLRILAESRRVHPLSGTPDKCVAPTSTWPLVSPPHAPPRRGQRGQIVRKPSPAGYCHPPTTGLTKTERGPISTIGLSLFSMSPNRAIPSGRSNFSFPHAAAQPSRKWPPTFWHQGTVGGPFRHHNTNGLDLIGIVAFPVLQRACHSPSILIRSCLWRRLEGMWISPFVSVMRHRAALSGRDERLGGFQRVNISGTDRSAKCSTPSAVSRVAQKRHGAPILSVRPRFFRDQPEPFRRRVTRYTL